MKLAIVAGEASGDLHAAEVLRELKRLDPTIESFGIGGDLLAREGMRLVHHAREMGIVGFFNVLRHLRMFRRIFDETVDEIAREKPDAVLLVDYPGFNLRMARRCKELGLRVVYYISPQLWAWRRGRVKQVAKYVDRMIVIFPFEETFYREHGIEAVYVGHPLIEEIGHIQRPGVGSRGSGVGEASIAETNAASSPTPDTRHPTPAVRIALLPGSRKAEVASLLPAMLDAVEILARERSVDAYVVQAPTIPRELLDEYVTGRNVRVVAHNNGEAVAEADVALSSSGTATLECAVLGKPVIVMYRLSFANYWLGRMVVTIPHFALINIVAGKKIVPELIQGDVNGQTIADETRRLLEPANYAAVVEELAAVRSKLGDAGAARRAAEAIMETIKR
ncbi:MAG TPA: lipid-A-disaccharide synthase [Thermoanaerobaculia bacterium]|jgi:lipid-A-disaccharide synthase|nr:lipid-A-disaccharide synthase [Thermoanaerobaculia bacterium]